MTSNVRTYEMKEGLQVVSVSGASRDGDAIRRETTEVVRRARQKARQAMQTDNDDGDAFTGDQIDGS